ncbi:MAG: hypothetical protein ACK5QS_16715 [Pseudanabaenaceae cyanobacterium]|jgi:antitoxin YefM
MVTAIKQMATVSKDGKIELYTPELVEGTEVEVILLVQAQDESKRLPLSNAANGEELVRFSAEEWHQKYLSESSSQTVWDQAMSEINNSNLEKHNLRRQRINRLFETWAMLDSEDEQKEALEMIESITGVSI